MLIGKSLPGRIVITAVKELSIEIVIPKRGMQMTCESPAELKLEQSIIIR